MSDKISDQLLDRMISGRSEFLTATGNEKGPLMIALEELKAARVRIAELEQYKEWADPQIAHPVEGVVLDACKKDAERMDFIEKHAHLGHALLSDDNGHFAWIGDGMQNVSFGDEPIDIQTTFFVEAADWHGSARAAIDAAITLETKS